MTVKVRFAPSPTGYLHAGNLRTALITWLFSRSQNGHFLLRIDDTDTERSKSEYEEDIESCLIWLGLEWDEKARQRERTDRYNSLIEQLKKDGRIYACYETSDELSLKRKALLSRGLPPIYDRAALELTDSQINAFEQEGRSPHWRFKLNHSSIEWNDLIRGHVRFDGAAMSDPVIIREDGRPLYHLCSVIDDMDYNITHVVRGEDHVSNTAAHIQMFEALGAPVPDFAHLPMISDSQGGKLSKRLGSMSARDFRDTEKLEPMAIISLLARLGSADPIVPFLNISELIEEFDISKFSKGAPKFDMEELIRLNSKILHGTAFEDVNVRLANMGLEELDEEYWNAVRPNLKKLDDILEWWNVTNGPIQPEINDPEYLTTAESLLPAEPWNETTWKEWTTAISEHTGKKGKDLFMPLRLALTGKSHGPELGVLLPLIGKDKVTKRLKDNQSAAA